MKLLKFFPLVSVLVFAACAGTDSSDEAMLNDEKVDWTDTSGYETDTLENANAFVAWAAIDGPDEYLWITTPDQYKGEEESELPEFAVLQIVPEQEYTESNEVCEWMLGILVNDFTLDGPFSEYSGPVEVYYSGDQNKMLAKYQVVSGKPDGAVKVMNQEGEVFIDWEYDLGKWVQARLSPYGANWTFNQAESKLRIMDEENAISTESGEKIVRLMSTFRYNTSEENSLYTVMEKESFNNPFQINGKIFTGKLEAYWKSASEEGTLYYELNFKDGWLDGDVKIYNDWGELELHELFVMGELDTTLYQLDYSQMDGVAKPIIYLYPEKETYVDVRLHFAGELTHTYPNYSEEGWKVLAKPDGTIYDQTGKEFYALYWEGNSRTPFTIQEGFVVPGDETASFLEKSLEILGLTRREANEFIVYWLPKLENNPYNLIHFSTDEYEDMARLSITPKPETLIRVMMVYQPLNEPVNIPLQDLNRISKRRKGFTVVEWGGSLYQENLLP